MNFFGSTMFAGKYPRFSPDNINLYIYQRCCQDRVSLLRYVHLHGLMLNMIG